MQVAEVADRAAVRLDRGQHMRDRGLRLAQGRLDDLACFVDGAEIFAVEVEMHRVLASQHGIRLRAGRDQNGTRGQRSAAGLVPHAVAVVVLDRHPQRAGAAARVDVDRQRCQAFGETDALFERLLDFFVIERVRRTVDQPAAVRDRHAAPRLQQLQHARRASFASGRSALGANRAPVRQVFERDIAFVVGPFRLDTLASAFGDQRVVARDEFLDLHRVVRQRLGGGIDRGQAAADDDDRQTDLHIRDRILARRAGELQRHQEVRCRAHAFGQRVRKIEHRRPTGAGGERNVVEAQGEGVFDVERAAEADAAAQRKAIAALDQKTQQLEEVLVPAHGDAVLGDAAESGHHALVQRLAQRVDVAYRLERHARAAWRLRPKPTAAAARS